MRNSNVATRLGLVSGLLVWSCCPTASLYGQDGAKEETAAQAKPSEELNDNEREFVAIVGRFKSSRENQRVKEAALESDEARLKLQDKWVEAHMTELFEFEAKHRGKPVGLMALMRMMTFGGSTSRADSPSFRARSEAVRRLDAYKSLDEISIAARHVHGGAYDPTIGSALKHLLESGELTESNKSHVALELARLTLDWSQARIVSRRRLDEIEAGSPKYHAREDESRRALLDRLPSEEQLKSDIVFARATLEQIVASPTIASVKAEYIGEPRVIARVSEAPFPDRATLNEKARGLLLKLDHLSADSTPPELRLPLIEGKDWSLSEQVGKVVIIQFSFTGCGPCERMYPELKSLVAEHGDAIEVLTILRDPDDSHAKEAAEKKTITWSIAVDDARASTCTDWAVRTYPTVYLIDQEGKIVGNGYRSEVLAYKVGQLLQR